MPATIAPADITLDNLAGGWMPDLAESAVPPNGFTDVLNLLPDRETGTLETRKGYKRFSDLLVQDYEVTSLTSFSRQSVAESETGKRRLIAVIRKTPKPGPRAVDDVQVWTIDVAAGTAARIDDPATRIWNGWLSNHYGITIDNVYYGGGEIDPMYSYRPHFRDGTANPDPWDPDASMGQYTTNGQWTAGAVYAVGNRIWDTVALEKLGGGLYEKKYVFVCTTAHTAAAWNRPGSEIVTNEDGVQKATPHRDASTRKWESLGRYIPAWESGKDYKVGAKVSFLVSNDQKFPRGLAGASVNKRSTFICVREHTSSASNQPPTDPWKVYRAPTTNVATFHGGRMFARDANAGASAVRYSELITESGVWDQTDWDSDDIQGAGYFPVPTGDGDDVSALCSLGANLIICKKYSTHVLLGLNPSTWRLEPIDHNVGALDKRAIVQHGGLVYFLSDQGLMLTDGVQVQEADGANVVREWLRDNIDTEETGGLAYRISMTSFLGFIWIGFTSKNTVVRNHLTVVYDPLTASVWKTDLPIVHAATAISDRVERMFFAKPASPAMIMRYEPATNTDQDDTGATVQAFRDIPWLLKTGWLTFGQSREQRRIRRIWALVKATAKNVTIKVRRNYDAADVPVNVTRTATGPTSYVEGTSIRDKDPHSVQVELSGDSAPVGVLGMEVQTQFRRKRWNRGPRG